MSPDETKPWPGVVPEYQRQEAMRTNSQVLSKQTLIKGNHAPCSENLHLAVCISSVQPPLSGLVVNPGGHHIKSIDHHRYHKPWQGCPNNIGLPGPILKSGISSKLVHYVAVGDQLGCKQLLLLKTYGKGLYFNPSWPLKILAARKTPSTYSRNGCCSSLPKHHQPASPLQVLEGWLHAGLIMLMPHGDASRWRCLTRKTTFP